MVDVLFFIFILSLLGTCVCFEEPPGPLDRDSFPAEFQFGVATAAYQIEGAWDEGGRGPSIWDTFSQQGNHTENGDTGNIADDHYHRIVEDIAILVELGVHQYRLSLSWSRLFPTGDASGKPNEKGVAHYRRELTALREANIVPLVTLYHWDLPSGLEAQGGWLGQEAVAQFEMYAKQCFELFGDLVHDWSTFNEPHSVAWIGYGLGIFAPGRCSDRELCREGDSAKEPYIVAHNILRAHALAVARFRTYKAKNPCECKRTISMVINSDWAEPLDPTSDRDVKAAQRYLDFLMGWFADPIFKGDYPQSMKERLGDRLPKFTDAEKQALKGSSDAFLLNHYTSRYVSAIADSNITQPLPVIPGWIVDQETLPLVKRNGVVIGPRAESEWLYVVPWGLKKLLHYLDETYDHPRIWITENGVDCPNEDTLPKAIAIQDQFRVYYLREYLRAVSEAILEGVKVERYFAWSLLDNFEWADGYSKRFGLYYVDYQNNITRTAKDSAKWYQELITPSNLAPVSVGFIIGMAAIGLFLVIIAFAIGLIVGNRQKDADATIEFDPLEPTSSDGMPLLSGENY